MVTVELEVLASPEVSLPEFYSWFGLGSQIFMKDKVSIRFLMVSCVADFCNRSGCGLMRGLNLKLADFGGAFKGWECEKRVLSSEDG